MTKVTFSELLFWRRINESEWKLYGYVDIYRRRVNDKVIENEYIVQIYERRPGYRIEEKLSDRFGDIPSNVNILYGSPRMFKNDACN